MALPGTDPLAYQLIDVAEGNVQAAHYQESDDRIEAQVYHANAAFPLSSDTGIRVSVDQDIYSGATPLFSVPGSMTGLPKRPLGSTDYVSADAVASASPVVGTFEVTTSMHGFKAFEDGVADYLLSTPPALQTVKDGLAAGYAAVLDRTVPDDAQPEQRFVTQPRETRNELQFGLSHDVGGLTVDLSGGVSREPDFDSDFGAVAFSWELNQKSTAIDIGFNYAQNDISRADSHSIDVPHVHDADKEYPELDETSTYRGINLGLSQVVSERTFVQFNAGFTRQQGYLSNPYKLVYIRGEITPAEYAALNLGHVVFQDVTDLQVAGVELFYEVRPERRDQWTFSGHLRHYFVEQDAALHLDYRYYSDDWDIRAHTLEAQWHQELGHGLVVAPSIRYYTQTEADFYAPYFLSPREDGHYSSDYRLSGYGALSAGLSVRKPLSRDVALNAGFEYYAHRAGLQLGGGNHGDFADYDSYLVSASLEFVLDGRGGSLATTSAGGHHAHHKHHGSRPPAGVMFGHVLDRAGDFMVGYSFLYGEADGTMKHGSASVADAEVVANACGSGGCTTTPERMKMGMHMFHLMYAPTDWLTLSVMPMLINKEMSMRPLRGTAGSDLHEHPHSADGLGDTRVAGLVKLLDGGTHDLHAGIALSIPTGDIDLTLDGTDASTSELQGYGMQLGSGTWDLIPSVTYTGSRGSWSWGGQVSATVRLESENSLGYRLGDQFQATAWAGYKLKPWLTTTLRGVYTDRAGIHGESRRANAQTSPTDFTDNYGGSFWDVGVGLELGTAEGRFSNHTLQLEWVEPVQHDYDGYRLEREGKLNVAWSYHF